MTNHSLPVVKPLSSVLVKPAGADCNIDCGYCFYLDRAGVLRPGYQDEIGPNRQHGRRMSPEVQEELIKQMMRNGGQQVSFGWQGGEPTLMGLDFFRRAIELQQKYGRPGQIVGNGLQTNGLLIDADWSRFLAETNWLVGLSIDGPPHIHNHYRVTRNRRPTYDFARRAAESMANAGAAYNALTVVNEYSVQFPEEIYEHHKGLGTTYMQFIQCVETDPEHPGQAAPFSVSATAVGEFLCRIYDLWRADFKDGEPTTSVRWFDSVFHTYVDMPPPECTLTRECGVYLVVEHNGDVFACDFFVEPDWCLGNVLTDSLVGLLNSERQDTFGKWKADLPDECHSCRYLKHCQGGCTKDRIRDPADNGSNHFCQSYMQFFDHAHTDLQELAADWQARQRAALEEQRRMELAARNRGPSPVHAGPAARRKVSRNDPCPCGSGKKYKKCCLLRERT